MQTNILNSCNVCMKISEKPFAQSAGAAEYIECPGYNTKQSDGGGYSNTGALGNAEYLFYCHRSQVHSGSEW